MKFCIENFGCQMNEHDMDKMASLLAGEGMQRVEDAKKADIVIVNTCCIREKAEQKFYSLMGRLRDAKEKKGTIIGVTGCIAQMEKEDILQRLPFIDFSLGPSNIHKIKKAIDQAMRDEPLLDFSENGCNESLLIRPGYGQDSVKAYVTIMKGCNNFCTYCVVPYVRGRESSRDSRDILQEVAALGGRGIKEVTLLGQNVNSYNNARDDISFPELLEKINAIDGIERIRFVTSHPRDLSPELIGCFGRLEKLCEHIHLPFQSGSDRILKLMNRGYSAAEYIAKVEALRDRRSGIAVTADCIVGFPGEDEEDFGKTMDLIERIQFDGIFSFAFSPRKLTAASTMPGKVPPAKAFERLHRLQKLQREITLSRNKAMEGRTAEVLTEGVSKNSNEELTGRTRTNKIVNFRGPLAMMNRIVEVAIVKGYANSLKGEGAKLKEVQAC
ncbi:MAG TPA: tRNA (N6-isopentenyl adenosine(37)-C2)-methylthiotransferase MiaB [Syntrophorhabdaceae bacterium]|nr:tRNA (N6-isopentenyl adenosine(37)-C2)-methylthiotransferase MiaB [Syntrophorhabdaceae bacterium]HNT68666.1 tRNA (N6-isopentenyl adenosine(37)-C2)-methylthiotransferase MiaB [Syntrophorhabdaceae bacterium]